MTAPAAVAASAARDGAADPYLPGHGNARLPGRAATTWTCDYRVASNRLAGTAPAHARRRREPLDRFSLDLAGLRVTKVTVDGRAPRKYTHRGRQAARSGRPQPVAAGRRLHRRRSGTPGSPGPLRGPGASVGWEELTDGVLVAASPTARRPGSRATTGPSDKATYRIAVDRRAATTWWPTARCVDRRRGASTTTWVYEQAEPMATYLATVQIGRYELVAARRRAGAAARRRPGRGCGAAFRHDFGRQPRDDARCSSELFGPYPFASYTVVVTDDELEIPLEAQGLSVFGANHLDGRRGARAAGRARAGAPVVRQQPDRRRLAGHLAARGVRLLRRVAVVRGRRVARRPTHARAGALARGWPRCRRTSRSATRAPS